MSGDPEAFRERLIEAADELKLLCMRTGPMTVGKDDCPFPVADVLLPILGFDVCEKYRGKYTSAAGARRVLRKLNYSSMAEAIAFQAQRLGWPVVATYQVEPGDLGVLVFNRAESVALLGRSGFWHARSTHGFAAVHPRAAIAAYQILPKREAAQ